MEDRWIILIDVNSTWENIPLGSVKVKRKRLWREADMWRCVLANVGSMIRVITRIYRHTGVAWAASQEISWECLPGSRMEEEWEENHCEWWRRKMVFRFRWRLFPPCVYRTKRCYLCGGSFFESENGNVNERMIDD